MNAVEGRNVVEINEQYSLQNKQDQKIDKVKFKPPKPRIPEEVNANELPSRVKPQKEKQISPTTKEFYQCNVNGHLRNSGKVILW
jgi:hypothetical protein